MEKVFLCGIKGTGMSSLALILQRMGYFVVGCDSSEFFLTQIKLKENDIKIYDSFDLCNIQNDIKYFIYSSAFVELELVSYAKTKFECFSYPDFLSKLTNERQSYAVCGTHGKTSVSALTSYALNQGNRRGFSFFSIYGSEIIGEDPVCANGFENLLIEGCEYQDHFLLYKTDGIVITNIEFDHPDYFKDIKSMIDSYKKLILNVKIGGFVVLNVDNFNTAKLESFIKINRNDLIIITYGFKKRASVSIENTNIKNEIRVPLIYNSIYNLPVINENLKSNYIASSILSACILLDRENPSLYLDENAIIFEEVFVTLLNQSLEYLQDFTGVVRRLEFISGDNDILYYDDYAHHPTEIETVYNELRFKYPTKKILTIFTPHTASRTNAMTNDFVTSLMQGDVLLLTPTFSSARHDTSLIDSSLTLYNRIKDLINTSGLYPLNKVYYLINDVDCIVTSSKQLSNNYICLILGAANKTYLIDEIIKYRSKFF